MNVQCGSYQYDLFEEQAQSQELERLQKQAFTLLETERKLWSGLNIVTGQSVLDVGCGSGIVTRELAKQVYPARVTGVDVSRDLLDKGKQSLCPDDSSRRSQANVAFRQGSIYQIPFAARSFDVVYARFLFQHLSSPIDALSEVSRVLKPGGSVCILDVDRDWSSIYPQPETPTALKEAIIERQLSLGGDPWVGRKLSSYLKSSGFAGVRTFVELIDSNQLGLSRFLSMLSFGKSYQSNDSEFAELRERVRPKVKALLDNPNSWAGFGLFVATGKKDDESKLNIRTSFPQ